MVKQPPHGIDDAALEGMLHRIVSTSTAIFDLAFRLLDGRSPRALYIAGSGDLALMSCILGLLGVGTGDEDAAAREQIVRLLLMPE